ncbi:MAG: SDR family oxidoreductase [Synergistaceae bacterium]|nr:SDR family oxidoreductase [Synergistaceae bacterium]
MSKVTYDFSGEQFVVTGASSGIGRQVALELAEAGACVLAVGRNAERLEEVRLSHPENIFTASLDVCDSEALEDAIASFVAEHGKLSGGVHAAGISDTTPLRSYDRERAHEIMNVSFWAGMNLLQLITRAKYGNPGTSTVLFSSEYSLHPAKGMFAYAAAKSAVNTAVKCAAKEIAAKKHRVNSILPGWTVTGMTGQFETSPEIEAVIAKHLFGAGRPEYISKMVLFLLSDASCWITGSNVVVDGGYLS